MASHPGELPSVKKPCDDEPSQKASSTNELSARELFAEEPFTEENTAKEPLNEAPFTEGLPVGGLSNEVPSSDTPEEEPPKAKPFVEFVPEEKLPAHDPGEENEQTCEASIEKAQFDDVVDMYNAIAKTIKAIRIYVAQFQVIKDNTTAKTDALPISHSQKKKLKAASSRLVNITAALSLSIAQVMIMEDFERTFRSEWKLKKKQSVALREVFLAVKTKEIEKVQADYKIELTKALVGANMALIELDGTAGAQSSMGRGKVEGLVTAKRSSKCDAVITGEETARGEGATQDGDQAQL